MHCQSTGRVDDSILIVPGAYARLENISEEGTWLQDEKFQAGDKLYERKKCEKVGSRMQAWRKCRTESPELFANLRVW